jgi:hypothetical protein
MRKRISESNPKLPKKEAKKISNLIKVVQKILNSDEEAPKTIALYVDSEAAVSNSDTINRKLKEFNEKL